MGEYLILKRFGNGSVYHAVNPETMLGNCDNTKRGQPRWQSTPGAAITCEKCIFKVRDGVRRSPTFECWNSMNNRCKNPSHVSYRRYGALGIKVCERWAGRGGFKNFLADMGERPKGMTLDRLDNTKDYGPDNCRWASASTQLRNRACLRRYEAFGKAQLPIEWAEEYGVAVGLLHSRLKRGWSVEKALTHPKMKNRYARL
jgi:hypothetical protein